MDGIKMMRAELGMTQHELATALNVSYTAINRWENDKAKPNKGLYTLLMDYARKKGVTQGCMEIMENSYEINRTRRNSGSLEMEGMPSVDKELLCQLVEEADNAIYVTDAKTDEILYANRGVEIAIGKKRETMKGQKCYEFLSDRTSPCPYCHKNQLKRDTFFESTVESAFNNQLYTARGKVITWNGREAHVRYVTSISNEEILQHVSCGICIYTVNKDQTLNIRYANEGYYNLCEGTKAEVDQAYVEDHLFGVCEEYKEEIRDFFIKIAKMHQDSEITYRCQSVRGNIKWVTAKAAFVAGEQALKDRIYVSFFDVTENVTNELHLQRMIAHGGYENEK